MSTAADAPTAFQSGASGRRARSKTRDRPGPPDGAGPGSASWPAFGATAHLVVADRAQLERAADVAQHLLADVQHRCDPRRGDSDLSRANRAAGEWVEVDELLIAAVTAAVRIGAATAGLAGLPDGHRVGLDTEGNRLRVPAGTRLDLGTTVRAFGVDLVTARLPQQVGTPALVSLGAGAGLEDVGVGTLPDQPQQWRLTLGVAPPEGSVPDGPTPVCEEVLLEGGGLATALLPSLPHADSGVPHPLDPRTGLPVVPLWREVTVSAATCLEAHGAAAAALLMGELAPAWLWEHGLAARLIGTDGHTLRVAGWPDHP
ncbi:FAD:protein FMN transferase [Spongisporangium articulatum]|uniref:FAD:protein FMN transferase n=1 Tax=Spongisporangium articulatum TaxID=3362603 RepID=A0ABW8AHH2_9ACTN